MGYTNDVVLILNKDGQDKFKFEVSCISNPEIKEELLKLIYSPSKFMIKDMTECYIWNNINWNIKKESISWMMGIIETITSNDVLFIRTGQEWFDFEVIGEFYNNPFDISLNITINNIN